MVLIPTAAIAAGASFTSKSNGTPAVNGKNTASHGIGVSGKGNRYGVFSNGPLGVAAGRALSCKGCVGESALAADAEAIQPLASGESETGSFYASDVYPAGTPGQLAAQLTFVRPVEAASIQGEIILAGGSFDAHCPAIGQAARGYLCVYDGVNNDLGNAYFATTISAASNGTKVGGGAVWTEQGGGAALAYGTFTVTAP